MVFAMLMDESVRRRITAVLAGRKERARREPQASQDGPEIESARLV
jgi:hypothetical protein